MTAGQAPHVVVQPEAEDLPETGNSRRPGYDRPGRRARRSVAKAGQPHRRPAKEEATSAAAGKKLTRHFFSVVADVATKLDGVNVGGKFLFSQV